MTGPRPRRGDYDAVVIGAAWRRGVARDLALVALGGARREDDFAAATTSAHRS